MNNKTKKLGLILLVVALFFLNPLFDFTDILTIQAYSAYSGVDVTIENLSAVYLDYFIFCMVIGSILLLISLNMLGWNLKRLWKKIDPGKYKIALFVAVLTVLAVAWIDIQGMIYWSSFSSADAYTLGQQGYDFWIFFKSVVMILFLILPLTYFFLYRRDFSEALSLWTSEMILWMFGFADVMYFVLQKQNLPSTMVYLNNHPVIGYISNFMGYSNVNPISLLSCVVLGFILAYSSAWILKNKF